MMCCIRFVVVITALTVSLAACVSNLQAPASPGGGQKSNLTPGMVKTTIQEGRTTQGEVLSVFGAPNIVTRDTSGREVWTYSVQSVSKSAASAEVGGSFGAGAAGVTNSTVIGGGGAVSGGKSGSVSQSSSSTFTLMITFDAGDVVETYQMQSTQF
jgi:hypothetical protein